MDNVRIKILPFYKIKIMKLFFNPILFLIILFLFEKSAYSMSDYSIKKKCQKMPKRTLCIKNLKLKKQNLLQGNRIEIPVIYFKK